MSNRGDSVLWRPALVEFRTWLTKQRLPGSQGAFAHGLSDFVPAGVVEHHLCQPGVLKIILEDVFGKDEDLPSTDAIAARCSIVFAILVCIGKPEFIGSFLSRDHLCDWKLPFIERPRDFPRDPSESSQQDPNADIFFNKFRDMQPRFCAPTLTKGVFHQFDSHVHLPFIEKEEIGEGGSAKVYRVIVHNKHDQLEGKYQESHKTYALKVYDHEDGEKVHRIETAMFKKLLKTGLDDVHMIGYHCSFSYNDVYYALLEYADMGTLQSFMVKHRSPSTNEEIESFWENLLPVFEALDKIHLLNPDPDSTPKSTRFEGVHQDIKPTNILVKRKPNASSPYECTFGLADLGTSSLIRSQPHLTARDNFGTKSYGSPECFRKDSFHDYRNIRITGKADVWSFACILSEACIWVMFGSAEPHGVEGYRERRQKYNESIPRGSDCFHFGGNESKAVLAEHNKVAKQKRCDPITAAILRAMPRMMHVEADNRPTAVQLRDHFKEVIRWAKDGADPHTAPSLEHLITRTQTPVRNSSRDTTQSSTSSSPLSPRRNRRLSRPTSHHPDDSPAHGARKFREWEQTDTPRAMTNDGQTPTDTSHTSHVVVGASDALRQQITLTNPEPRAQVDSKKNRLPHRTQSKDPASYATHASTTPVLSNPNAPAPSVVQIPSHVVAASELSQAAGTGTASSPEHPGFDRTSKDLNLPRTPHPLRTPEPPLTPGPSRSPKPPARLSLEEALEWKRKVKKGGRLSRLSNQSLFNQLRGRDHVFVIDDCETMGELRAASRSCGESDITDYVEVLSYMVKRGDDDGMDLYYFNSEEVIPKCKKSTTFVNSVQGKIFKDMSSPEGTLKRLLEKYIAQIKAYGVQLRKFETQNRKRFSLFSMPDPPKPLSIYVLTDGIWESPDDAGDGYLKDTIGDLIEALRSAGCRRNQIGIQFIRFGKHPFAVQRLEALDHLGRSEGIDL